MKSFVLILSAALLFGAGARDALAGDFQVTRKMVQLWSGPDDDMRPEISGTVTEVNANTVGLEGGAIVPVNGPRVNIGDLVTFVCSEISQGPKPEMKNCELLRTHPPEKASQSGPVKLW